MKNNTKNLQEMGMLSLSNLTICIKKAEFSNFEGQKWIQRSDSIQIISRPAYSHLSNKRGAHAYQFKKIPPSTFIEISDFSTLHSSFIRFMY